MTVMKIIQTQIHDSYNLQLHGLPVHIDGPDLEVHSNGGDVALGVRVILKRTDKRERWKASM